MVETSTSPVTAPANKLRVAVEGCGHGTLHAIYASIEKSCQAKGWDGVDLVIIGGDFQAVRNAHDLNVTAMPQKYRRMADFHEYYSGSRMAPYLTIFIGGNHEASNHLFELYYGGWVAPNIYYLGAANVLNVGPLRIAGLSGIWKGYDYRKPHFERLPYNQEDLTTIFHVRELDVRKLLSLRSQIDVGLSHDWPEGVVWHGQYRSLFSKKRDFEDDAVNGRLGSIAARECLQRLRPAYWFAAHLHCKYTAIVNHEPAYPEQDTGDVINIEENPNGNKPAARAKDRVQVSAWQSFHEDAAKEDTDEREQILCEREQILYERQNQTGESAAPKYIFKETFKKVTADDNLNRKVDTTEDSEWSTRAPVHAIPQVDGCSFSAPRKRRREGTDSPQDQAGHPATLNQSQVDGPGPVSNLSQTGALSNPDAIDIDMSDDDDSTPARPTSASSLNPQASAFASSGAPDLAISIPNGRFRQQDFGNLDKSEDSQEGGLPLDPVASSFQPPPALADQEPSSLVSALSRDGSGKNAESSLTPSATRLEPQSSESSKPANSLTLSQIPAKAVSKKQEEAKREQPGENITEDMRAELAALSKSFAEPDKVETSPTLPFPTEITNKTTQFLALDKCEPHRDFLQLLEIGSITSAKPVQRPVKLEYDSFWLATLRTFASEMELGGDPKGKVAAHRGETYYNERILEEAKWVRENVVEKDLLQVPQNFTVTAPVYDPTLPVEPKDMPKEYTNPQTTAFCELIGIENKFDTSEEERDARMTAGPREDSEWFKNKPKGFRGGRQGGRGGRGGRGGGRGGRGGGRGRGRW